MKFTFAQAEEGFDNHINASIRGYSDLVDDVIAYSDYFVEEGTHVVDIGCSTGAMLRRMSERHTFSKNIYYIGIDIESDFQDQWTEQYANPNISYHLQDVREFDFKNCSLVTSIFTLQFMNREDRQSVVKAIYNGLNFGGAFIFSEKTYSKSAIINEMRTFNYYDYKKKNFSEKEILDKEYKLRHMMRLMSRDEIVTMLLTAGFSLQNIDTFWQNHGFTGFVAIKR